MNGGGDRWRSGWGSVLLDCPAPPGPGRFLRQAPRSGRLLFESEAFCAIQLGDVWLSMQRVD